MNHAGCRTLAPPSTVGDGPVERIAATLGGRVVVRSNRLERRPERQTEIRALLSAAAGPPIENGLASDGWALVAPAGVLVAGQRETPVRPAAPRPGPAVSLSAGKETGVPPQRSGGGQRGHQEHGVDRELQEQGGRRGDGAPTPSPPTTFPAMPSVAQSPTASTTSPRTSGMSAWGLRPIPLSSPWV